MSNRIYVASSWRNPWQPDVVKVLRDAGHEVYDYREPRPGESGFSWREIDPEWKSWSPEKYREAMNHPIAQAGYKSDIDAIVACDTCVLVHPCGMSAHLELGYACGAGKRTCVLFPTDFRLTPVSGHSYHSSSPCAACGDLDGCHLPGKLRAGNIEPELMAKMADAIIIGKRELLEWL